MPEPRAPAGGPALASAALALAAHVGVALLLCRSSLAADRLPGVELGEAWGRVFVTAQVSRWLTGQATPGQADLLAWPEGMPFWPVDPLLQLLAAPLSWLLGDLPAYVAVTVLTLALAGFGTAVLGRQLGAGWLSSAAAGVAVQLSPTVIRHASDAVLEALALGPAALAMAAMLRAARRPQGGLLLVALSVLVCAATSPYLAVYLLTLSLPVLALFRLGPCRQTWSRLGAILLSAGLAAALAAAPVLATELGPQGRLGPGFAEGGFRLSPGERVLPSGSRPVPRHQPTRGVHDSLGPRPEGPRPPQRPPWALTLAQRLPGGAALLLVTLLGLLSRRSRPVVALALAVLLLGPEPWISARFFYPQLPRWDGPMAELFRHLPLLSSLGNATRLVGLFAILAAATAARLPGPPALLALALVGLAAGEAALRLPGLALPSTPVEVPAGLLEPLSGPTVVFPSGDPPSWHPRVAPKEVLFLAGRAGVPVAYDYGRTRLPADLAVQARLSVLADTAIARAALSEAPDLPDEAGAWAALPFQHLLVLEDRLAPDERARLLDWLETHAELQGRSGGWSRWSWPSRF